MERKDMDKDKFIRAIEINNKIEEYKDHKMTLENSNIKYGGGLIFTYNRMHNDVPLKEEIFGKNFFQLYMYALDSKIKEETKQTAEEAARGYSNDCRNRQRHCEPYCIVDFISGAQWQSKQSPWISVKERLPEEGQKVFVLTMCCGVSRILIERFYKTNAFDKDNRWIFGNSIVLAWFPIPSFDEILEANRDTLERIKQKVD